MKILPLWIVMALTIVLSGCLLKRTSSSDTDGGTTSGGTTGGTSGGTTTKALTASDWINSNRAFTIDMRNAVTNGTNFHALRGVASTSCDCVMQMSATASDGTGTYTSVCTAVSGSQSDCDDFTTNPAVDCVDPSVLPVYEYTGTMLTLNPCESGSTGLHFQ